MSEAHICKVYGSVCRSMMGGLVRSTHMLAGREGPQFSQDDLHAGILFSGGVEDLADGWRHG